MQVNPDTEALPILTGIVGTMLVSGGRFWIFLDLPPLLTGAAATCAVVEHEIGENRDL